MRGRLASLMLGLAVMTGAVRLAHAADADEVVPVRLEFAERRGELVVGRIDLGDMLFDERAYRRLEQNPLATLVVVRFYIYRAGETTPISFRLLSARIVYDLWLEEYEVRIDGAHGRRSGRYVELAPAFRAITALRDLSVADLADIAIGPHYYLAVVAELNPVSEETMAEVRRWLTRPAGATRLDRETSFFGSFVSIFVNARLPEAEHVIRARSQPFYRVSR